MKSYTDIKQSKKLAEFLPIESADMYRVFENNSETRVYYGKTPTAHFVCKPCWSLSALLEIIRISCCGELQMNRKGYFFVAKGFITLYYSNSVDACYEMITRLRELNLL